MHRFLRPHIRVRQQGQTLIIALIVLGVLLILGLVFLGVINRNILNSARSQRRSEASDLAEAGIRYAHGQLVSSPLGADWRGAPTLLAAVATGSDLTGDPDAYYLRPGNAPNSAQRSGIAGDLGGPDGLGPYVRIPFPAGRALVRVRYGASDANPAATAGGPLRNPGAARSMLIIEAIGRPGVINPNDPTTFNQTGGVKFQNFTGTADLQNSLSLMASGNGQVAASRRLVAFAPIGIIDAARYETNVFNSSAPIEIGIPTGLGISAFNDVGGSGFVDVGSTLPLQLGTPGDVGTGGKNQGRYGGSFVANGDVLIHGHLQTYLNRALGDGFRVSGRITGADGAVLQVFPVDYNATTGAFVPGGEVDLADTTTGPSFDSQDPSFDTAGGLVLDGSPRTDGPGFSSGVGAAVPPSALTLDPETKLNRYVSLTRESGANDSGTGSEGGAFGYGSGVFVDNAADRQEPDNSEGRRQVGSQRSLFDDWLNPNSGAADTGWQGPFYVPPAAVVQLLPDGFSIQRDGKGTDRFWKNRDGSPSGLSTIRYRLGLGTDGVVHVLNTLNTPAAIDGNLAKIDFDKGLPFNGVLYFEGNVRVRGTIPTGVQMTLVSGATIYIDGSILKGTTNNEVTGGTRDQSIPGLPTASLMLMAKENVAVNTTMFVGPAANQTLTSVNDTSGATGISPVRMAAEGTPGSGSLRVVAELPLDPNDPNTGNPLVNASLWQPYAMRYKSYDTNTFIGAQLLLSHTMDDGTGDASFFALSINGDASTATSYQFDAGSVGSLNVEGNPILIRNAAAEYTRQTTGTILTYGLGVEPWQRYSRFETRAFPLLDTPGSLSNTGVITGTGRNPLLTGSNDFLLQPTSVDGVSANDTLFARAALAPGDVKIEASIFAEQGSFFIIPGPWFNPNPNDRHDVYVARVAELQTATGGGYSAADARIHANRERLENYGTAPEVPFFDEPLDVRVNIVGSVAENLPPPISVQAEWLKKWAWIPRRIGATGVGIPKQHVPGTSDLDKQTYLANRNFVPNLVIQYDPILATGRVNDPAQNTVIRSDAIGRPLPPMPRLPVSPKLAYFGEL